MKSMLLFYRALADESRLRMLRLLDAEALNVSEIVSVLGLSQSSVSQKLRELRAAGIVIERKEGGYSYHEIADPKLPPVTALIEELRTTPDAKGDLARLGEVLRDRRDRGEIGGRLVEPGRSWIAWARALRFVLPALDVVDLGCGDGALTAEIAAWAQRVVGVERDPSALESARNRATRAGLVNVEWRHEDIAETALKGDQFQLAVLSHALHFAADPEPLVDQAVRLLVPGGRLIVLELRSHSEHWVEHELGHRRLGFEPEDLATALEAAGLAAVEVELTPRSAAREPFRVLIASGVKP